MGASESMVASYPDDERKKQEVCGGDGAGRRYNPK
jgi:hypothetical protein